MITFGSVCSGIESPSVALTPLKYKALWFAENAKDPSKVLSHHYPDTQNFGDIRDLPDLILQEKVSLPQVLFGGTPCQAFSLAGNRNGLNDIRGSLTLAFVEIVKALDTIATKHKKQHPIVVWENVEGVLSDRTNAFGCFLAGLLGENQPKKPTDVHFKAKNWGQSGHFKNENRTVAWRILDSKHFGCPQQRKRVFVVSTPTKFSAKNILGLDEDMKMGCGSLYEKYLGKETTFQKDGHQFLAFRDYTDCLYSAYGTKWNGNSAAINGSLFFSQNDRLRRFSVLECERLMGFPDHYTQIPNISDTSRYKMLGNSWVVSVVKWLGYRIIREAFLDYLWDIHYDTLNVGDKVSLKDIVDVNCSEKFYISRQGKQGILRRADSDHKDLNPTLKNLLQK
jgi:DNA (cytosine-5)-methyltransferase 1